MQHDAQLSELRNLFQASPHLKHYPFEQSAIVLINRNGIFKAQKCKRCVPRMAEMVERLKAEFQGHQDRDNDRRQYEVLQVFGSEPYEEQVRIFRRAAVVIGPHGAALTSMLHVTQNTAIVEFIHKNNVNRQCE